MTPFLLLSILQIAIYPHYSFQSPTPFLLLRSFFSGICHQSVTFRFRNFSVSRLLSIFGGLRFRFRRIWSWKKGSVSENKSRYQFWSNFWSRHSMYSTRLYLTSRFPYCVFSSVLSWKTAGSGNSMGVNNF